VKLDLQFGVTHDPFNIVYLPCFYIIINTSKQKRRFSKGIHNYQMHNIMTVTLGLIE
jgi:hypothetical protein